MKITPFPRQCYYTEEKEMKKTHFASQRSSLELEMFIAELAAVGRSSPSE